VTAIASASGSAALPAPPPLPPGAPTASPHAAAEAAPLSPEQQAKLPRFYEALHKLEAKKLRGHVRILWLGDSHGAADFWSGALRTALQKRFGDGGPGFVHVGYKNYRHDDVSTEVEGTWGMRPKGPATTEVTGDGQFGLGGILLHGGDGSRATVTVNDPALPPQLSWELCFRLDQPKDAIAVELTGVKPITLATSPTSPAGSVQHARLVSAGEKPKLAVRPTGVRPELCGAIVEADPITHAGVVLDTLGINGARFATPLAWNEDAWKQEVAHRDPTLAILEYGTNEASNDLAKPEALASTLTRLVERLRAAKPTIDCLVVGGTDRADKAEFVPKLREAFRSAAAAAGCGYWDTYEVMGGKGSIQAWAAEKPPRAAKDGIHLTARGYRELGDKLFADLMKSY
jgi:lysophospholipase L1-like esterase